MTATSTGSIRDARVRLKPCKALLELLNAQKEHINEMPANLAKAMGAQGYTLNSGTEILQTEAKVKAEILNTKMLRELLEESPANDKEKQECKSKNKKGNERKEQTNKSNDDCYLYVNDLKWLNVLLKKLRDAGVTELYLHHIIEMCKMELPQNEQLVRDAVLEARCQRLREQQQNREYRSMTKNVDSVLRNYPEDTIAYQMKVMNSQIIAVLQFVFSVVAGFVFGFLGVELIIGNLDFGFRLLMGIICALIIALAEIYFLAKKLNEYDDIEKTVRDHTPIKKAKPHVD